MTANQVIEEIERLPVDEQHRVFERIHELEEAMIPDSFLQGMTEAGRGDLIEMQDDHFDHPPA